MIAGLLQLASRHPSLDPAHHACIKRFLGGVRQYAATCPFVLELLDRGDDPAEDR